MQYSYPDQQQLINQLEGIKLDSNQQPPLQAKQHQQHQISYQSQINNNLSSATTPDVFVSNGNTNNSNIATASLNIANNGSFNHENSLDIKNKLNEIQNESKSDKVVGENKSSLPNYQQFTPSYTPSPNQQTTATAVAATTNLPTLFNPNLTNQISTYQSPPINLHQQLPTSNQTSFSNYQLPPQQINYSNYSTAPVSQFNVPTSNLASNLIPSIYSPPPQSYLPQQQQQISPLPISQNLQQQQQQSFIHNLPTQSVQPQQAILSQDKSLIPQTNLQQQQTNPSSQQQQQPPLNYQTQFTTPLNLPNMPPLNVSIDTSSLNNLAFETIINNKN